MKLHGFCKVMKTSQNVIRSLNLHLLGYFQSLITLTKGQISYKRVLRVADHDGNLKEVAFYIN